MFKKPETAHEIADRIEVLKRERTEALSELEAANAELAEAKFDDNTTLLSEARAKQQSAQRRASETIAALQVSELRLEALRTAQEQRALGKFKKERSNLLNLQKKQAKAVEDAVALTGTTLGELRDTTAKIDALSRQIDPTVSRANAMILKFNIVRTVQAQAPHLFKMLGLNTPPATEKSDRPLSERLQINS